jgi:uncharacterized protein YjiS (DUF1127 family)
MVPMSKRVVSSAHAVPQGMTMQMRTSGLVNVLRRWLMDYRAWRNEQAAIARLRSMSDRELKDIGVTSTDIAGAVRRHAERYDVYSRYY